MSCFGLDCLQRIFFCSLLLLVGEGEERDSPPSNSGEPGEVRGVRITSHFCFGGFSPSLIYTRNKSFLTKYFLILSEFMIWSAAFIR